MTQTPHSRGKTTSGPLRRLVLWALSIGIWIGLAVAAVLGWFALQLPDIEDLEAATRRPGITVLAADGSILANSGDFYGTPFRVEELPRFLPQAVVAIEDRRFYSHPGVDPIGLARALWANLRAGRTVQGGSTITQQVAKNVFLTPERTLKRKLQEALLALWLERHFSKNQILAIYLNRVYLGAGTYGVDAAAQRYFNKQATKVTLQEAAVLAGLLKAPARYSPARDPGLAARRARLVLQAMADTGVITAAEMAAAQRDEPMLARAARPRPGPYFTDWVLAQLPGFVQVDRDLVVRTTLDPGLQHRVDQALASVIDSDGAKRDVAEAAAVFLGPDGAVRALAGGSDYAESQYNRAVQALRQPGSAFKLFVYLAALERGATIDQLVTDAPISIKKWSPQNYDGRYRGDITLAEALAQSLNTVAVRLTLESGPRAVIDVARRLGITAKLPDDASIALGTGEVSLLELTAAYGVIGNGGTGVWPYGIVDIADRSGAVLWHRSGSGPGQVLDPDIATTAFQLLRGVVDHGTGKLANFDERAIGKTGTTQDFRDAWFIGSAGELTGGIWMGNDDNHPTRRVTGGDLPARIWRSIMDPNSLMKRRVMERQTAPRTPG